MKQRFPSMLFDEKVVVSAIRGNDTIRRTFSACIMPFGWAETMISETAVQTNVRRYTILISSSGDLAWIESEIGSRPRIGDRITLPDGNTVSVTKVAPAVDTYYELEAKE